MRNTIEIKIQLMPSQVKSTQKAIALFCKNQLGQFGKPHVQNNTLTIHPADFVELLGYLEKSEDNLFEVYRIAKLGREAIVQKHKRAKNRGKRQSYSTLLYCLKDINFGHKMNYKPELLFDSLAY